MSLNEIVKTMQDAVNRQAEQATPGGYDTTATVRRIEDGTAWVHIPGGVDETPVKLTINAKVGDNVQVRVSGGNAFLVGNGSAPPTDDARANQAYTVATVAEGAAENALANASRAKEAADSAQSAATRAESAAGDAVIAAGNAQTAAASAQTAADTALVSLSTVEDVVGVLNWITEHGTMTLTSDVTVNPAHVYFIVDPAGDYVVGGTHYSIVSDPKDADLSTYYELTVDESVQNYVATHIVVDSEGLWIIPDAGGNKVLIATGSGSTYTTAGTYIVGKVNGVDTVLASFTASGAVIGVNASGKSRSILTADGMQIYRNDNGTDTQIANLGYGLGYDGSGNLVDAPFYTFGIRSNNSAIGNYSTAEGQYIEATDSCAHAEGTRTVASRNSAHAEGSFTEANNFCAHSEGFNTQANGPYSHAQNYQTRADSASQTVIGKNNIADSTVETFTGDGSKTTFTTSCYDPSSGSVIYSVSVNGEEKIKFQDWDTGFDNYYLTVIFNEAPENGSEIKIKYGLETYSLIIGNGTANNARSNALTVDWSGNVDIASGAAYKINGTALAAADVGAAKASWTALGSKTGNTQSLTVPNTAKEVYVLVHAGSGYYQGIFPVGIATNTRAVLGGYYYSSSDYGTCTLDISNSNKTYKIRNVLYAGSNYNSTATIYVYYR